MVKEILSNSFNINVNKGEVIPPSYITKEILSNTFNININKISNRPSVITNLKHSLSGKNCTITFNIHDEDNDKMNVYLTRNSKEETVLSNQSSGNKTVTVNNLPVGTHIMSLRVNDGKLNTYSDTFRVTVEEEIVNNLPTVSNIQVNKESSVGVYELEFEIQDLDNDRMDVYLKIGNSNYEPILVNQSSGVKQYKGQGLSAGTHTCFLKVSDGKQEVISDTFNIRIQQTSNDNIFESIELITPSTIKANTPTRVAIKLKSKTNIDKKIIHPKIKGIGNKVKIHNAQFEKGNVLTDWRKSVSEISNKTSNLKVELENMTSTVETIKDDYVTSSQIKQLDDSWTAKFKDGYNEGITTINKDGVTVTSNNVKSKTSMSANGFKITKTDTGEDVFKVNEDGTLAIKGNIIVTGGSVPSDKLTGTISADRINTNTLKGKTLEGGIITSSNSEGDYTTIQGGYIESYGTVNRSWLGVDEGEQTIKLKSENGKFRVRNDSLDRSVYLSDRGLATTKDGNILSSGILDFHNDWYGYNRNGISLYSINDVGLIARNGYVNISPEWSNTGNNTFSFQVQNSTDASSTHGLIYYGSHKNGYGTLVRLGKASSEPYLQVLGDGYSNTGTLKAYKTSTTLLNNNYFTAGSLTINQTSQGVAKGTQTYLTGTTISATNIYQNGANVSGSDIVLKDNIKEFNNALDIIEKTKVYEFNRILANQDKKEIGFLAQDVPEELLFDKGTFTKEEVENLSATEKKELIERKTLEQKELRKKQKLEEISEKINSFYGLDEKETEKQIDIIMEEYNNIEYEVPISTINQNNVIGVMFQAIKEQQELIKKLENRIVELEKRIG